VGQSVKWPVAFSVDEPQPAALTTD